MTLSLIRHAHAGERGPWYPDDRLRPLTAKGRGQARALAEALGVLGVRFDRLFSSPYTRAVETAEALLPRAQRGMETLDGLAGGDYPELVGDLGAALTPGDEHVALVGHEPYLGELTSFLLVGTPTRVALHFKKGMLVQLEGDLEPGALSLHLALPPKLSRRLAEAR